MFADQQIGRVWGDPRANFLDEETVRSSLNSSPEDKEKADTTTIWPPEDIPGTEASPQETTRSSSSTVKKDVTSSERPPTPTTVNNLEVVSSHVEIEEEDLEEASTPALE